ncbi:MAG TPA: histidine kinase [Mobilitalea sp.]|nr:histidine kinase [Mobilitalea sp.]
MKKHKYTYIEKNIALLVVVIILYIVSTFALLFFIGKSTGIYAITKVILTFVLLIIPIILINIFRIEIIRPLKQSRILSEKLVKGQVYREYMDYAGKLYPGVEDVLKHFDMMLNDQQINHETKRRSEFLALQNQINPHFLYNTLEAIRGDALSAGMDNIADITEALSTFFRYSVTDTGSLVTLADELENVDSYFKIQQYRFGENLELVYEIPGSEDILELMCPKLTLQPIVENAIFHGLEKRADKGKIVVRLEMTDNKVLITIKDNGVGMDGSTLEELNNRLKQISLTYTVREENKKKGGIALVNVSRRIRLLFGENYGIHVFSILDFGTDIRITLPIVKNNQEYGYERRTYRN